MSPALSDGPRESCPGDACGEHGARQASELGASRATHDPRAGDDRAMHEPGWQVARRRVPVEEDRVRLAPALGKSPEATTPEQLVDEYERSLCRELDQ